MYMRALLVLGLLLLQACEAPPRAEGEIQPPVLAAPEAGLDDPAAYEGYATRFFRDSEGNSFQIYLDNRVGRVVHVWADSAVVDRELLEVGQDRQGKLRGPSVSSQLVRLRLDGGGRYDDSEFGNGQVLPFRTQAKSLQQ